MDVSGHFFAYVYIRQICTYTVSQILQYLKTQLATSPAELRVRESKIVFGNGLTYLCSPGTAVLYKDAPTSVFEEGGTDITGFHI